MCERFVDGSTIDYCCAPPQNHKLREDVIRHFARLSVREVLSLKEGSIIWVDRLGRYFEKHTVSSINDRSTVTHCLIVVRLAGGRKHVVSSTANGRDCVLVGLFVADEEQLQKL